MKCIAAAAAAFFLADALTGIHQAHADGASTRLSLAVEVPPACSIATLQVDGGTATLREMCNTGGSYTVVAHHDPAIGGRAIFTYGGQRTVASRTGATRVYAAFGAANVQRRLSVEGASEVDLSAVSLEIVPAQ